MYRRALARIFHQLRGASLGLLAQCTTALLVLDGCGGEASLTPPEPPSAHAAIGMQLHTDVGSVSCELFPSRAPHAVALIAELAAGTQAFRDPVDGRIRRRRYYDGLTFFRRIPGALVQTGCPVGNGTGHPGFRIAPELHPDDHVLLAAPGAIVMAAYHAPPNRPDPDPPPEGHTIGSQWSITLRPMRHLAGQLPVVGRCHDLEVVRKLAQATRKPKLQRLDVIRAP